MSTHYTIRHGIGITLDEELFMDESETASFQLIFPPLPEDAKVVHFTEGDFEGSFQIWGIRLDGQPAASPLAGKYVPRKEPVLEMPAMNPGIATLTGNLAGYFPDMHSKGRIVINNVITDARNEYPFEVAADGSFAVQVPMLSATAATIYFPFYTGFIYMQPGKATHIEFNLPEIARSQSRLQKNKSSLGDKYLFSGAFANLNNEAVNHPLQYLSISPQTQQEQMQMMSDMLSMRSDEEIKNYWIGHYETALKEMDKYPDLSHAYKEMLGLQVRIETAELLFSAPYIVEAAYRMENGLDRTAPLPEGIVPELGPDYYSFVRELIPVEGEILYNNYIDRVLNILPTLGEEGTIYAQAPALAELMGTDKGMLFDLLAARRVAHPISEFMPLTEEQLAEAESLPSQMKAVILEENDKLIATIEANKKKSGYTVNPLDTQDIPNEELFAAIMSQHRGKVIFVDFWATWCGPCLQAFKNSAEVKKEMEEKGVVFVYLAGENSPKGTWENMIPDIKGEHYRVTGKQWDYWYANFNIQGIPTYMVISKDGTILTKQAGFPGSDWMRNSLNSALEHTHSNNP